jgi:antitoxin (DNA-binding transcriptional repressor) of toxin-antitoxin stability system
VSRGLIVVLVNHQHGARQPAARECPIDFKESIFRGNPCPPGAGGRGKIHASHSRMIPAFDGNAVLDSFGRVIHIRLTMKTATVRDLRNRFPRVAAWIAEGEPVEITKAGKLFARLVPPAPVKTPKLVKPDIMARLKETWGDRIFSSKEVAAMRAAELDGEEG